MPPITFNNVAQVDTSGFARGLAVANQQIQTGFNQTKDVFKNLASEQERRNTAKVLEQLRGIDTFEKLKEAQDSGSFTVDNFSGQNVDINSIISKFNNKENTLRTDFLSKAAFDEKVRDRDNLLIDKQDQENIDNLLSNRNFQGDVVQQNLEKRVASLGADKRFILDEQDNFIVSPAINDPIQRATAERDLLNQREAIQSGLVDSTSETRNRTDFQETDEFKALRTNKARDNALAKFDEFFDKRNNLRESDQAKLAQRISDEKSDINTEFAISQRDHNTLVNSLKLSSTISEEEKNITSGSVFAFIDKEISDTSLFTTAKGGIDLKEEVTSLLGAAGIEFNGERFPVRPYMVKSALQALVDDGEVNIKRLRNLVGETASSEANGDALIKINQSQAALDKSSIELNNKFREIENRLTNKARSNAGLINRDTNFTRFENKLNSIRETSISDLENSNIDKNIESLKKASDANQKDKIEEVANETGLPDPKETANSVQRDINESIKDKSNHRLRQLIRIGQKERSSTPPLNIILRRAGLKEIINTPQYAIIQKNYLNALIFELNTRTAIETETKKNKAKFLKDAAEALSNN